jgi:hypothetical protein
MFCEGMNSNPSMVGMYYACQAGEGLVQAAVIGGTVVTVGALALTCLGCCTRRQNETPLVRNVRRSCIACGCCAATLGAAVAVAGVGIAATVLVEAAKMFYSRY